MELVIDLTDSPKNVYDNETLAVRQSFRRAWISGLRREYISIHAGQDAEMFVVTFRKGAARPIVGMPLTELTEQVVEGDLVFGQPILQLREALLEAETPEAKMAAAERHLLAMAGAGLQPNPFVEYAVGQILKHPGQLSLEHLSRKVGYSQKHLIQLFISGRDTCRRCYLLYEMDADGGNLRKVSDIRLADSWMSSRKDGTELIVTPPSLGGFRF